MSCLAYLSAAVARLSVRTKALLWLVLIWTVVGVVLSVPDVLTGGRWPNFVAKVIEAWTWALLTPIIFFVDGRLSAKQANLLERVGILLLLSIPFSLVHTYTTAIFLYPIHAVSWNPLRKPTFGTFYFIGGLVMYCAVVATMLALQYYKRYLTGQLELERVQRRLLQSHLNALRLQLEPHFLFNALNAISSEVVANPELARDMIEDLGALLRLSLDFKDRAEICLSQEIDFLEHYLAIQKIRFGDRLMVTIEIDPEVTSALVPCMVLQPLVENAIRHGISGRISGGGVAICAKKGDGYVELCVQDDGVGLPHGWQMAGEKGLGLTVTKERLDGLYPDALQHFDIHRREGGGTEVILRVPLHTLGEVVDDQTAD